MQTLLQPNGIGVLGTEVMTSERVEVERLSQFAEVVADSTLTMEASLGPFLEATLHVGVVLIHDHLKSNPLEPPWRWPWWFDRNRLYLMIGWIVHPMR